MLRQRRYPQRNSLGNSLNIYSNENFCLRDSSLDCQSFYPNKYKPVKGTGLTEMFPNNSNVKPTCEKNEGERSNQKHQLNLGWSHPGDTRQQSKTLKNKEQDNIFSKINELIKHEENGLPICHSFKHKIINPKERPYTSLSNRNRKFQESSVHKFQVVLDLTPKQESQELPSSRQVSTSRALMNFSQVYRNSSGDRFKVKRDKQYMNHFSLVSAQKMVLKEKDKNQKKLEREKVKISKPRRSYSRAETPQNRYQEEDYHIEGWDFFE